MALSDAPDHCCARYSLDNAKTSQAPRHPRTGEDVMARFIIECNNPIDIIVGMKAIQSVIKDGGRFAVIEFNDDSMWLVRKTKTGWSARKGF